MGVAVGSREGNTEGTTVGNTDGVIVGSTDGIGKLCAYFVRNTKIRHNAYSNESRESGLEEFCNFPISKCLIKLVSGLFWYFSHCINTFSILRLLTIVKLI